MRFYFDLEQNREEYRALAEVLAELGHELGEGGIPVTLKTCEKGVQLTGDGKAYTLAYSGRSALMRGAGLLCRYAGKPVELEQIPAYDVLGNMPDCSRNAVMNVAAVKKLCRLTALMGFNALMLYTEDTYEIKDEPFFGHLRGRYTAQQLQEMDEYAALLGIELIPCIQTLAHLEPIFQWPEYAGIHDVADILNVAQERVYELVEKMVATMTENLRSRRINIGMDEAFLLGRGKYLEQAGYHTSNEIMLKHLDKVVEICKKYGQQPRMWSDMFFRMATPTHTYRNPNCNVTEEIKAMVPPEVTLVFWDYYSTDKARYDRQLKNHLLFRNPIAFAGGDSGWYGLVPLNMYAVNAARAALQSARECGIREVYSTMWRSCCSAASHFAVLPTMVLYGEDCWSGDTSDENLSCAMEAVTGCKYEDFLAIEQIENLPCRQNLGHDRFSASNYMLWQDPMEGKFDAHVPAGAGEHFGRCRTLMQKAGERAGSFGYIFRTLEAYCHVLEEKAELGVKLKAAYDAGDRAALAKFRDEILPDLLRRTDALYAAMETQWLQENKALGFATEDVYFGNLKNRLQTAIRWLDAYLTGKTDALESLAAPRLPLADTLLHREDKWKSIALSGILW